MSLPIYQRVAVTDAGDVIPGAEYTVINENTGVAAPIYSDRTGATLLSAPYFADSVGTIQFFIAQGTTFRVAASGGVGTYTDRYVYGVSEAVFVSDNGNVGIGTSSPVSPLNVRTDDGGFTQFEPTGNVSNGTATSLRLSGKSDEPLRYVSIECYNSGANNVNNMVFKTSNADVVSERVRIDSAGNLLVGTTTTNSAVAGHVIYGGALAGVSTQSAAARPLYINRLSSDGDIIELAKDDVKVGSIGTGGGKIYIGNVDTGLMFDGGSNNIYPWSPSNNAPRDNALDLGYASNRFQDIYATNNTIQTSDRNEKQDIEEITEAEAAVAKACRGLLRSFRWKSAVNEKGDVARIHFGIMAQDLQDAFTAEGLDAGRYGMFISTTWWETQAEVAAVEAVEAVEAVTDEDGNVTTEAVEAVEAKDAYTRTDTFQTLAEAPAGATERTRLGVRYSELLAFIIAAL